MTEEAFIEVSLDGYWQLGSSAGGASLMRSSVGSGNIMVSGGSAISVLPRLRAARSECWRGTSLPFYVPGLDYRNLSEGIKPSVPLETSSHQYEVSCSEKSSIGATTC